MNIIYKDTHHFDPQALQSLFLSVDWSSGHYPDKLAAAMKNYETVFSAWDGERLIGLLSAMDDGVMTAYIHYLLVDLAYQHRGIGRRLVEQAKEKYRDYLRLVLISYDDQVGFYRSCGFEASSSSSPMFITSLWT